MRMKDRSPANARAASAAMFAAWVIASGAESLPAEIIGEPLRRVVDGTTDDLLSAGLGAEGLRGPAPGFGDPLRPTAVELRRRAVWSNYRGLADLTDAGGFGRLSGPRPGERIAGVEYLAAVRKPSGRGMTTVMLQVPVSFNPAQPCLVAVAASGSRGIYGALPTAGEWGLRQGCAVVHTDKGAGTGFYDFDSNTAWRIDLVATTDLSDPLIAWQPGSSPSLEAWRQEQPHRLAVRHAHGSDNPEREWGQYLLQAIEAGFILLQREFPAGGGRPPITRDRTLVLASGISNGGSSVLRAVESDRGRLIDGAVVSEPNVAVTSGQPVSIRMGERAPFAGDPVTFYESMLLHYRLQPAAVLAPSVTTAMTAVPEAMRPGLEAWTTRLAELGFVIGTTTEERARDARRRLVDAGVLREALDGGIANVAFGVWPALGVAYGSAYARARPESAPCGTSYAAVDAGFAARALTAEELAKLAADSSGIPPTGGVQIVDTGGRFASFGSHEHLACLQSLGNGAARKGVEEIGLDGRVGDVPVIVLHGRLDALIPVNFTSRAWYARHLGAGGSTARYYEVDHGHHFDAFNALPGWAGQFVPLQPYLIAAMDLMQAHLVRDDALPPSQVVRTTLRGTTDGTTEPLAAGHLGPISASPGKNAIRYHRGTLRVPE
jgi:hydroxybutyrate-dimer hydrolase